MLPELICVAVMGKGLRRLLFSFLTLCPIRVNTSSTQLLIKFYRFSNFYERQLWSSFIFHLLRNNAEVAGFLKLSVKKKVKYLYPAKVSSKCHKAFDFVLFVTVRGVCVCVCVCVQRLEGTRIDGQKTSPQTGIVTHEI